MVDGDLRQLRGIETISRKLRDLLGRRLNTPGDTHGGAYSLLLRPRTMAKKMDVYEERDLSHGQQMVECFKPFLRHLLSSGPSRKTLRSHRDNLWILGDEGGPLISHGGSEDQHTQLVEFGPHLSEPRINETQLFPDENHRYKERADSKRCVFDRHPFIIPYIR